MADKVLEQLKAQNIFDLRGVVAVVTGGGSGIGMMISSTLVANGATVYIVGPKQQELDAVCAKYNEATEGISNGRMHGLEGDIRLKSEATRLASEISTRSPEGVTVLFNNAGISSPAPGRPTINADGTPPSAADFVAAYFDSVTQEQFTDVFATNAVGPFWLTFAFLPLLEKWKSSTNKFVPQVIMTSSMNGWTKRYMWALVPVSLLQDGHRTGNGDARERAPPTRHPRPRNSARSVSDGHVSWGRHHRCTRQLWLRPPA
ncbi:NAD(P)-binding protein [Mycena indigotica]|uniref:NAD(P)-binding protein n=1 Tax=Mycena indigotica TaxID=2126181 RepID=A0A8H6VUM6_9AGAR|nr:NAD(P)-binding protein [Mycena indigotica]KAF7292576.1 NAD(P)-binding protein [Mycena indigotica]